MPDLIAAREEIHVALREELVGPAASDLGRELDTGSSVKFASWELARGPWRDAATREEILTETTPLRRYGVGILHPAAVQASEAANVPGMDVQALEESPLSEGLQEALAGRGAADEGDDLDLSLANAREQSTVGLSFRVDVAAGSLLTVEVACGRYRRLDVKIGDAERTWWVRQPVGLTAHFDSEELTRSKLRRKVSPSRPLETENCDDLEIEIALYSREVQGSRLITATVTNRTSRRGDAACLFQAGLRVSASAGARVLPYPEREVARDLDAEERSIALLYRHHQTFAIGHGCAGDWEREPGEYTTWVEGVCLPAFETPSVTPDITRADGSRLRVDMRVLARPDSPESEKQIGDLLDGYGRWILLRRADADRLPEQHRDAAVRHLDECETALRRMRAGWSLVKSDENVATAFQLANEAMVAQQARSSAPTRSTTLDAAGTVVVSGSVPTGELPPTRGLWRPFQIAFFLASLESVANRESVDREVIDLIFFPTGGGKTEAYLGLSAFSLLLRRLRDPSDNGTEIIMRYTLRLLTAQQFLRAATLVCALERLRGSRNDLGEAKFSIGIWLGGATTPNNHTQAIEVWNSLVKDPAQAANKFLLLRCPWCGAQTGPTEGQQKQSFRKGRRTPVIPGYVKQRDRVSFACPDRRCEFKAGLPLYVVDEDIYNERPSMVIGTVDKFAMLAWRPQARSIFGLDEQGTRVVSPPGLIIQDEFHLISGPLGSMVGLYEAVIEDLCTDRRGSTALHPKIVASTATIRRYVEQATAVYGRNRVALFPPQGLAADDAFFAVWARGTDGKLLPGRRYVGVHAPALGSMQTVQVRVAASLAQAPMRLEEDRRDAWWTNLWFFNSLRELGNTLSLLQSDIPDYLLGTQKRDGIAKVRYPGFVMELTSRRRNDEIPRAIEELQQRYDGKGRAVDVCLASNIIEVGVDIDRLSLMTILGQPKTTAQYIQVSGRIGRLWEERPGLVVTLYGAAKPRDRSHYERFRSYHERLYAQVEPTSVTPFAKPVMRRALHAAVVAHVRLTGPQALPPWPYPEKQVEAAAELLLSRAARVDAEELDSAKGILALIKKQWSMWDRAEWEANSPGGDPLNGLMRYAGTTAPAGAHAPSWEVPSSMRSVDAECRVAVTTAYHTADAAMGEQ